MHCGQNFCAFFISIHKKAFRASAYGLTDAVAIDLTQHA
jgi:hypothetical protein